MSNNTYGRRVLRVSESESFNSRHQRGKHVESQTSHRLVCVLVHREWCQNRVFPQTFHVTDVSPPSTIETTPRNVLFQESPRLGIRLWIFYSLLIGTPGFPSPERSVSVMSSCTYPNRTTSSRTYFLFHGPSIVPFPLETWFRPSVPDPRFKHKACSPLL